MRIERIEAPRCDGGESPLWDARAQVLWFIDNTGQKVHRHHPGTGANASWDMPNIVTALALRESGGVVVALRSGLHALDVETGALELLAPLPDPPPFVFNDGKADPRGRFVVGASTTKFANPQPEGGVYCLDPDHTLRLLDTGIHFSNGNCWSPDYKLFYFSDSFTAITYAFDYDLETGALANRRRFADTSELGGVPDGATTDRDGLLWMAIFRGAKVVAFRPDGRIERIIETPVRLPSAVMFGGPDLDLLYLTTIARDVVTAAQGGPAQAPEAAAGYVHVIEGLGARGLPEPRYAG
jgi:sugar lactone lactonase YvrE